MGWWRGWQGPQNWRLGPLPPEYETEWKKHKGSFIALAAFYWKITMDAFERSKMWFDKKDILDVRYEDFCADPIHIFKTVSGFCELDWSTEFIDALNMYTLINTNDKWDRNFTEEQQTILEDVLSKHLKRYGYM